LIIKATVLNVISEKDWLMMNVCLLVNIVNIGKEFLENVTNVLMVASLKTMVVKSISLKLKLNLEFHMNHSVRCTMTKEDALNVFIGLFL
jgi:hypothetical protein